MIDPQMIRSLFIHADQPISRLASAEAIKQLERGHGLSMPDYFDTLLFQLACLIQSDGIAAMLAGAPEARLDAILYRLDVLRARMDDFQKRRGGLK